MENQQATNSKLKKYIDYAPLIDLNECLRKLNSTYKDANLDTNRNIKIEQINIYTTNPDILQHKEQILKKYSYKNTGCGVVAILEGYQEIELGNCCKLEPKTNGCVVVLTCHKICNRSTLPQSYIKHAYASDMGMAFIRDFLVNDVLAVFPHIKDQFNDSSLFLKSDVVEVSDEWADSKSGIFIKQELPNKNIDFIEINLHSKIYIAPLEEALRNHFQKFDLLQLLDESFCENNKVKEALSCNTKANLPSFIEDEKYQFYLPPLNQSGETILMHTFKGFTSQLEYHYQMDSISNSIYDYINCSIMLNKFQDLKYPFQSAIFDISGMKKMVCDILSCPNSFTVIQSVGNSLHNRVQSLKDYIRRSILNRNICLLNSEITHTKWDENIAEISALAKSIKDLVNHSTNSDDIGSQIASIGKIPLDVAKEFINTNIWGNQDSSQTSAEMADLLDAGFYPVTIADNKVVVGVYNPALRVLCLYNNVLISGTNKYGLKKIPYEASLVSQNLNTNIEFKVLREDSAKIAAMLNNSSGAKSQIKCQMQQYVEGIAESPMFRLLNYIYEQVVKSVNTYDTLYHKYIDRKNKLIEHFAKQGLKVRPMHDACQPILGEMAPQLPEEINVQSEQNLTDIGLNILTEKLDKLNNIKNLSYSKEQSSVIDSYINQFLKESFNFSDTMKWLSSTIINKASLESQKDDLLKQLNALDKLIEKQNQIASKHKNCAWYKGDNIDIEAYIKDSIISNVNSYIEDLEAIASFPRTKNIEIDSKNQRLYIDISDVNVTDDRTGFVYDLGDVVLSIPFSLTDPSVFTSVHPNRLGWLYRQRNGNLSGKGIYGRTPVVHGNGDDGGSSCLGNADSMLRNTLKTNDLMGTFLIMVRYADSVNTVDSRGQGVDYYRLKAGISIVDNILPYIANEHFCNPDYKGEYIRPAVFRSFLYHLAILPQTFKEFQQNAPETIEERVKIIQQCIDAYNQKHAVKILIPNNSVDGDSYQNLCINVMKTAWGLNSDSIFKPEVYNIKSKHIEHKNIPVSQFLSQTFKVDMNNICMVWPGTMNDMCSWVQRIIDYQNAYNRSAGFSTSDSFGLSNMKRGIYPYYLIKHTIAGKDTVTMWEFWGIRELTVTCSDAYNNSYFAGPAPLPGEQDWFKKAATEFEKLLS